MSEPVDQKGYPCKPRNIDDKTWFYEEPRGIQLLAQGCPHSEQGIKSIMISWRRLEAAVDRHRKIKAKRKKR